MAKKQAERIDKYSWAVEGTRVLIKSYPLMKGEYGVITQRPTGDTAVVLVGEQRELIPLRHLEQVADRLTPQSVNKTEREYLTLDEITIDGGTQSRAKLNLETIEEYATDMAAGAEFPPVEVYYDGERYWLADGFHRLAAYKKNQELDPDNGNWQNIAAKIHQGDRRAAILHSVGANSDHGLRRTNADKRRAVTTLLMDGEWSQWSDREIAKACGVSNRFVSNLRGELSVNGSQIEARRFRGKIPPESSHRTVNRNGKEYTMNTTNIGKSDLSKIAPKSGEEPVHVEIVKHSRLPLVQPPEESPSLFIDRLPLPEVRQIVKPITSEQIHLADDVTIGLKSSVDILTSHHVWAAHKALAPRLTPEELEIVSEDWSDAELLDLLKNSQNITKAVKQLLNKRHHPEYFKGESA